MSDGNYLASARMPEGLEDWQTVQVYCQSWATEMKPRHWQRWLVSALRPWHVWRYDEPVPGDELMAKAAAVRERMGVKALEGNGWYHVPEDGGS